MDGITARGKLPPPTCALPLPIAPRSGRSRICASKAPARTLNSSVGISIRAGKLRQRFSAGRFNKSGHEEIASMHFQDQRRVRSKRSRVIAKPGFVRGADLTQFRATGFKNVWDAKAPADLDQFTARD